jgi:hypothetical protein
VVPEGVAFPEIPGIFMPRIPHLAYRADYGPNWTQGIVDFQPPLIGEAFPVFVPQVDGMGNEMAGLRGIELLAPLATYMPWSLRTGAPGGADHLISFLGTYIPLPLNDELRATSGDPRPSLAALYGDREGFMKQVTRAAEYLVASGILLERDRKSMIAIQGEHWDWLHIK